MTDIFYGKHRGRYIAIYLVILVFWIAFIFYNSAADGIESTEQTNRVIDFLKSIIKGIAPEAMVDAHIVRKTAHFLEFFVLGALYYTGSFFIRHSRASLFFHSLSASLFTAFLDETLQMFSAGRSPEVKDIWIDLSGAFIAHVMIFAIYYSYKFFRRTK